MRDLPGRRHFVYRCFGYDGRLLYIGATSDYDQRVKEYDRRREVRRIERQEYPTRAEAFAAEHAAIVTERPAWNINGKQAIA